MGSLPPALLARLQKRGIVKSAREEVIAESYDAEKEEKREENVAGAPGCPNKNNPFHLCTDYCYDFWREGTPEKRLSEAYLRKRRRMLAKYPLPEGWTEVYDAGMARHYYWNQESDQVCWVSPRHPLAVIGEPAPRVARNMSRNDRDRDQPMGSRPYRDDRETRDPRDRYDRRREPPRESRKRRRSDDGSDRSDHSDSDHERLEDMSDRDRVRRAKKKGIDPMDPAAYGDAPVGNWSSGLRAHDKTGADVTASGPLFQQRPYPAPGAILRSQGRPNPDDDED